MSFKMKPKTQKSSADFTAFEVVVPEEGLAAVQLNVIADLGLHKKLPKFAKDAKGVRELKEGKEVILWPQDGEKGQENRYAAYIDLLSQTHDYEGEIGVKNIRMPLHTSSIGVSEGLTMTPVAPRDKDGKYIKGKPWLLAPASMWTKIAKVALLEDGKTKVSDVIFKAEYSNEDLNDVGMLLGKKFMMEIENKETEKGDKKYVNSKAKSPVSIPKGMTFPEALQGAVGITFDDDDLLEAKPELGGATKLSMLRKSDLHKIVLALDYPGTKMQAAIQEKFNESELIAKAKENFAKIVASSKDLKELKQRFPEEFAKAMGEDASDSGSDGVDDGYDPDADSGLGTEDSDDSTDTPDNSAEGTEGKVTEGIAPVEGAAFEDAPF